MRECTPPPPPKGKTRVSTYQDWLFLDFSLTTHQVFLTMHNEFFGSKATKNTSWLKNIFSNNITSPTIQNPYQTWWQVKIKIPWLFSAFWGRIRIPWLDAKFQHFSLTLIKCILKYEDLYYYCFVFWYSIKVAQWRQGFQEHFIFWPILSPYLNKETFIKWYTTFL